MTTAEDIPTSGNIIEVDGFMVDEETGEIMGLAAREKFRVCDMDSAEWVMQKMQETDAAIFALQERKAVIIKNLNAMLAGLEKRRDYLDWRFTPELQEFTARELAMRTGKSIKTPFGTLGFRRSQGSIKVIADQSEMAISWAKKYSPAAVKTQESILVSELKSCQSLLPAGLFDVTPPHDVFRVDTGIGKKGKGEAE